MFIQKDFFRRRWVDGRTGHTTYFMFFLTLVNCILITFSFLIEQNEIFSEFISNLWLFAIIFIIIYFPASIFIGRWHTNTQLSVEKTLVQQQNPIMAKMVRTLLDVQTGKATKEEIEEFRKMISKIEKRDADEY